MAKLFIALVAIVAAIAQAAAPERYLTESSDAPAAKGGKGSKGGKKCGAHLFTPKVNSTYCGKFKVNSVPVKIKLVFVSATKTDIFGSVYGFDMYCMGSPFLMCEDGSIDLDPEDQAEENCLRRQFEGVDEHMSSLTVKYRKNSDRVQFISDSMKGVYLKKNDETCNSKKYEFAAMKEDGPSMTTRRI